MHYAESINLCWVNQWFQRSKRNWFRLQTTLAQIKRIAPKWICTVFKIFSPFTIFEQLALALKNQSCPEIFHCVEYTFCIQNFWATCACPEEQLHWNFSLYWIMCNFYHSGLLSNLRLPWKTELPWKFSPYWNIFYSSGFLSNSRLPWKTELPWNFPLYWIMCTFIIQEFWETCAYLEKQSVPWIHCTEYVFFIIQDFWATCVCPEKQSCPGNFHCIEIYFIIQDFWATRDCPERQSCPGIFHVYCNNFCHSGVWATRACPENRVCPEIFHCIEYTFYIQTFWAICACHEKQRVPWIHCTEYVIFIVQNV